MEQVTVIYDNFKWEVWGFYTKGFDYNNRINPPEPSEFDICEVYKGDNDDIINSLRDEVVTELSRLAIEKLN